MSRTVRPVKVASAVLAVVAMSATMLVVNLAIAPSKASAETSWTAGASAAWNWIRSQLGTGITPASDSTIALDEGYDSSWTGPVRGTFTPVGVSTTVTPAAVAVDTPTSLPGSYTGVVTGHVTLPSQANRWIVQVYRDTAAGRSMAPLQALASATDGSFTLDLAAAGTQPSGTWAFGVLDAQASYAPYGLAWPAAGTYDGWSVQLLVTTDTTYFIGQQPAAADGVFNFASSPPGTKTVRLVDSTGAILAEAAPMLGLVRSFGSGGWDQRVYTYDQATALLAALRQDDQPTTNKLTEGLLRLQITSGSNAGGFVEVANARNPAYALQTTRAGINAIASYALLERLAALSPSAPGYSALASAAAAGVQWLLDNIDSTTGLVHAGAGVVQSNGTVDGSALGWYSTEHQLDAWHALRRAASVLGGTLAATAAAAADDLADAITDQLWTGDRFIQGLTPELANDLTDPLDVNSWGSIFFAAQGADTDAATSLARASAFASFGGYRAYYPQAAFPSAPTGLWFEGTFGVAMAQARAGDTVAMAATVSAVTGWQNSDGSFPYASMDDLSTGMTTAASVAATAWYLLLCAESSGPTIWS